MSYLPAFYLPPCYFPAIFLLPAASLLPPCSPCFLSTSLTPPAFFLPPCCLPPSNLPHLLPPCLQSTYLLPPCLLSTLSAASLLPIYLPAALCLTSSSHISFLPACCHPAFIYLPGSLLPIYPPAAFLSLSTFLLHSCHLHFIPILDYLIT